MATQSGTFTFALPEDADTNQLLIYSATTKNGTYSLDTTVTYEYGTETYEYDSMDDTKWYKIKFNNSTDSEAGPLSDPVFGGNFSQASPFLAVSTRTDGAYYATVDDVYNYSTLTTQDVSISNVSIALRRARAVVDQRTADLDINRFSHLTTPIARKKYNASLRVLREVEILLALGVLYVGLADDLTINSIRGDLEDDGDITIGSTAISGVGGAMRTDQLGSLLVLGAEYRTRGMILLGSLQPGSIKLIAEDDFVRQPRFRLPFNGY